MSVAPVGPLPAASTAPEEPILRVLVDDCPSRLVWLTDLNLRITAVRGGALATAGCERSSFLGESLIEILGCHDNPDRIVIAHMHALTGEQVSLEVDWNKRSYSLALAPLRDVNGAICGAVGSANDVTELRRAYRAAAWNAMHDSLTALPNRSHFRDTLNRSIVEARRGEETLALILMDLDDFTSVNDAWGQQMGDEVLRQVATLLRSAGGEEVFVARTDGDEFAILIAGVDSAQVEQSVERLSSLFLRPFEAEGQEVWLTASFGGALHPTGASNAQDLIRAASVALRRSKDLGGNQYHHCSPSLIVPAKDRLTISNELRGAIERRELSLHYQPQIRLADGALVAMEALLRWNRGGEIVSAAQFIHLAEESHLIVPIGTWVIDEACRQYTTWASRGIAPQRIAVNVGAKHFHHPRLVEGVRQTLDRYGLLGSILEIEITETAAMQDLNATLRVIEELRAMGAEVAIDDFGTGHSSLSYLREFPITALKIDRSFVSDLPGSGAAGALVNAIMSTGKAFGLRIVAEGVETHAQLSWLRDAGCDEGQGFLFAKPVDAEEASTYLRHAGRPSVA
jgi:diguanylate cyclase (GGDEF)-like protein